MVYRGAVRALRFLSKGCKKNPSPHVFSLKLSYFSREISDDNSHIYIYIYIYMLENIILNFINISQINVKKYRFY